MSISNGLDHKKWNPILQSIDSVLKRLITIPRNSKYVKGEDSVPYWIAPERDPPECNNDKGKANDIWNFGIYALELFHSGSPLTSLLKSEPLLEQNNEKIGLSDGYENYITNPKRLFDKFCGIVMSCLRTEPILC